VITEKFTLLTGSSKILTRSLISINATQVKIKLFQTQEKFVDAVLLYVQKMVILMLRFLFEIKIRISRHVIKNLFLLF
jgi:hypothetical protein